MTSHLSYSQWKNAHKSFLETLPSKHVFLLFSGGNDSSAAMGLMLKAGKEFGFDFEAHAGAFPVHRYCHDEIDRLSLYWRERGGNLVWHNLAETDEALTAAENPCTHCQSLRKKMLKTLLPEMVSDWKRVVLVAGYSLWDLASYSIEHILADAFSSHQEGGKALRDKRFLETAQRFHPLLAMKEGYTVFRPLIKYNGDEIMNFLSKTNIPTISIPCKYARLRPKRILEDYYQGAGLHFDYDRLIGFAKRHLSLPGADTYASLKKEDYLRHFF
jgi:tRNA(Ile)-lysidine synthase TilS/MesJ